MSSRLRSINSRGFRGVLGPVILIILFLLLVFWPPVVYLSRSAAYWLGQFLWLAANPAVKQSPEPALAQQVASLKLELAQFSKIEQENEALQKELGHVQNAQPHLAFVLSALRSSPYETIIIDQGGAEGLGPGQQVVSEGGVALGEVVESYEHVAKVELYSAYGRETEALLPDGTRVLAAGAGSQNFVLRLPQGLKLETGWLLSLPSARHPVLAQIAEIKNNPGDAFQSVYARSPVNVYTLERVYVED